MSNQRVVSSFLAFLLSTLSAALGGCVETLVPVVDGGPPPGDAGPPSDADVDARLLVDAPVPPADGDPPPDGGPPADSCLLVNFFADADMDGFGDPAASMSACTPPTGYVTNSDDCDDAAMGVSPDATERCDLGRVDENCSGMANEGCECDETQTRACPGGSDVGECVAGTQTCDATGSWGGCVGAVAMMAETCNGLDDDCDGANDGAAAAAACGTPPGVVTAACPAASCAVGTCTAGLSDCNATFADGCEVTLGSITHCTACGAACGWDCESTSTGCNDAALTTAGGAPVVGSSIAAGSDFTCALRQDGTVVCWGSRAEGRLGDGMNSGTRSMPAPVTGLTGVTAIAAGTSHACALVAGAVHCWGDNDHGQLGDGTFLDSSTPVAARSITNAVALDVGDDFTCVVRSTGRVACWGSDVDGRLGNGAITGDQSVAVDVAVIGVSPVRGATAISLGDAHACAVVQGAALGQAGIYCWGRNVSGQVGDGTTASAPSPVDVSSGFTGHFAVAAGAAHSCAASVVGSTYSIRCWGENGDGQVGDGTIVDRTTPTAVSGLARVTHLTAGGIHTCARLSDASLRCWGGNTSGQLGDGSTTGRLVPTTVVIGAIPPRTYLAETISAGAAHTCAVEADGTPTCWGSNGSVRLGVPTVTMSVGPTTVTAP